MKKVKLTLAIVFAMTTLGAIAQETSVPKRIVIIENKFFDNLPKDIAKMSPKGIATFMISTPNATNAVGIKLPVPLPDAVLQDTIPMSRVPEAAELLRRFNEAVSKYEKSKKQSNSTQPLLQVGTKFPDFTATDMDGKIWRNADTKGKIMVLNVWFTGCGPCRAEMPELSTWKDEMPDVMFFSSTYESPEVARPVIENRKFNWIPLVNDTLFDKYIGNKGYPLTVVVNKEGIVTMTVSGTSADKRKALKQKIQSLLK